ncbi:hypothetical protein JCM11641_007386 [Rhodosporidiobolus odoratus]
MSLRVSLVRLAQHARQPLIRFPDRTAKPSSHAAEPHPCAPQETIDAFPRFQNSQKNPQAQVSQSSSYGGPALPPKTDGSSGGSSSGSVEQSDLPEWLRRSRWAPNEEEIEAVMTGGASATAPVTKDLKLKWYTPQI